MPKQVIVKDDRLVLDPAQVIAIKNSNPEAAVQQLALEWSIMRGHIERLEHVITSPAAIPNDVIPCGECGTPCYRVDDDDTTTGHVVPIGKMWTPEAQELAEANQRARDAVARAENLQKRIDAVVAVAALIREEHEL